ncbi:MAG: BamA/TamA family outer membrane protein [Bacteroidota bacterium]
MAELQFTGYRTLGKYGQVGLGPFGRTVDIDRTDGRFTADDSFPHPEQVGNSYREAGIHAFLNVQHTDNNTNPTRGVKWKNQLTLHQEVGGTENQLARLSSEFSIYLTPTWPRFQPTLAIRAGVASNVGDYKFFQAQSIGNLVNLRRFRRNRFAGRTLAYQNLDLRIPFFKLSAYVFKGNGGFLAFADQGRVWLDGEQSNTWHRSVGPGIWFNFYGFAVISATYAFSPEENLFTIQGGFFF